MTFAETLILAAYFFVLVILAIYGWHRYYLVYLYMRHKDQQPVPRGQFETLPVVTIQLPLYNEMYVVDRLVESVCRIEYPRDLLEIQVLDDSIDETREIAELAVRRFAAQGIDIKYVHRTDRTGYKAGALEAGLQVARGEFIAIFDADFIPQPDFLTRTIQYFTDPKVAMIQTRWGHVNEDYSLLTKIQALLLDAHFVLEHGSRNRGGCFFNFNGTAGIWRRDAITDAGGWQHDTLTEDLDLSYRAQLRGWQFIFLPDHVAPAELPVEMNAFKSQQHRWAKGSIQTFLKLMPLILQSKQPFRVKAEAFFHLSANFNYPLMCVLAVLMGPSMIIRYNMGWYEMLLIDIPLFVAATASVANFYMVCQRELYPQTWTERLKLPALRDGDRHRAGRQQHQGGVRGPGAQAQRVRAHAQVPHRGRQRRVDWQEVPAVGGDPAADRDGARPVFHRHPLLRAGQRHLRHGPVPDAVPGGLPVYRDAVAPAAVRRRHGCRRAVERGVGRTPVFPAVMGPC